MDDECQEFLKYWFSGFINGLERVDEKSQEVILRACGLACAQSYTEGAFQEARQNSTDLASFLFQLGQKFPAASYTKLDERTITVRIGQCGCDLVNRGWVKAPLLCKCSVVNMQQNFERSLGERAQVKLISSILDGAGECVFEVTLLGESRK